MTEIDNNSLQILLGSLVVAAIGIGVVMRLLLSKLASKYFDTIRGHGETIDHHRARINDLSERTAIIEQTVVKDKELNRAISDLRDEVYRKLESVNDNIDKSTKEFRDEHKATRQGNRDDLKDLKEWIKDLYTKRFDE